MDDLRFVVEQGVKQVDIGDCPFRDQLEIVPLPRPLQNLLDLLGLDIEAQSTCTVRVRRQEEYRAHSRTPSGSISGPGHGCQEVQSLHSGNVIHESG